MTSAVKSQVSNSNTVRLLDSHNFGVLSGLTLFFQSLKLEALRLLNIKAVGVGSVELRLETTDFLRHHTPDKSDHQDEQKDAQDEVIELCFLPKASFFAEGFGQAACRSTNVDIEKGKRKDAVIAIDELSDVYIGDGEGISQQRVRAHERDSRQEVNIGPMRPYRTVQDEEFLEANHLDVNHVTERVPADKKCRQVGQMLGEKVENNGIDSAPKSAPDLRESIS